MNTYGNKICEHYLQTSDSSKCYNMKENNASLQLIAQQLLNTNLT